MTRTGTWERFERMRNGESLETLLAEAEAAREAAEPVSPRTKYPAPAPGTGTGPRAQERKQAAAEVEAQPEAEEA
jgi:hypothetical protein